jgi:transcriptional regulator with XRE-family HTH domain
MKLQKIIGNNIKAFRTLRKMTQEDLAAKAKLHRAYIGFIERGERNLSVETIVVVAEALRVPSYVLLMPEVGDWVR